MKLIITYSIIILLLIVISGCVEYKDEKLSINFQNTDIKISENQSVKLCKSLVVDSLEKSIIKSPVETTYNIIRTKEFFSYAEADKFSKEYSTLGAKPLCKGTNNEYAVAVVAEIKFPNGFREPLTGLYLEKLSDVYVCDENGNFLERGYGC